MHFVKLPDKYLPKVRSCTQRMVALSTGLFCCSLIFGAITVEPVGAVDKKATHTIKTSATATKSTDSSLPPTQDSGTKAKGSGETNTTAPAAQALDDGRGHQPALLHTLDLNLLESERESEMKKAAGLIYKLYSEHNWKSLDEMASKLILSEKTFSLGVKPEATFFAAFDKLSNKAEKSDWNNYLTQLKDFAKACPQSQVPGLLIARAYIDHAWHARGSGYADTVSPANAQLFRNRLNEADQEFQDERKKFAGKNNCIFYSSYAKVALGEGWPRAKADDLFNEGFAKYPNFTALHIRRAIFLLPRWHGRFGECLKDLSSHCDKLSATDGDIMYARVCAALFRDKYYSSDFCKEFGADWQRLKRGFVELEKRYPDELELLSLEASMATDQKDRELALEAFRKLGTRVDISYWRKKRFFSNAYKRAKR